VHTDSASVNVNLISLLGEGFDVEMGRRAFDLTSQLKVLEICSGNQD